MSYKVARKISLNPYQSRMLFAWKLDPDSVVYSNPFTFDILGELDCERLREALYNTLMRHEALRSCVKEIGGVPHFYVFDNIDLIVSAHDFSGLSQAQKRDRISECIDAECGAPFDLYSAPLSRYHLIKITATHHILLMNWHHLCVDGVSLDFVLEDIASYYNNGFFSDENIATENQLMRSIPADSGDVAYWVERLKGSKFHVPLMGGNDNVGLDGDQASCRNRYVLSSLKSQKIKKFLERNSISLFQLLLGVLYIAVHKYTNDDDFVIGYSVGMRVEQNQRTVGFLVNNIPFRLCLNEKESIASIFQRIKLLRRNDRLHQACPLTDIIAAIRSERKEDIPALFNMLLNHKTYSSYSLNLNNLKVRLMPICKNRAKNDFTMLFDEESDGVILEYEYNTKIFTQYEIHNFAENFEFYLSYCIINSHHNLGQMPRQSPAKLKLLLNDCHKANTRYSQFKPVHELFKAQTQKTPDNIALLADDTGATLTYSQLDYKSDNVAQQLIADGVEPKSVVAVMFYRSFEMIVAILGVLKVGAAYLPIEPDYPIERIKFILGNSQAKFIVTVNECLSILYGLDMGNKVILIDSLRQTRMANVLVVTSSLDDASYVIYTSGSTGNPKGAINTHAGTVNRVLWMQMYFNIAEQDKVFFKTPYTFDVSVWEIFLPLLSGATMVIAEPEGHANPEYLHKVMIGRGITVMHFVPSMLKMFLLLCDMHDCNELKHVISSGEVLERSLVRSFYQNNNHALLYNLYGPTEASIDVTCWRCRSDADADLVPIGEVIDNMHIYVLDEKHVPVPVGVPGELYIGGIGVAKGYINNSVLTEELFIANPFEHKTYRTLYKTGDLVKMIDESNVVFLRRTDRQVKLRGLRIELDEIEQQINKLSYIQESAVIIQSGQAGKNIAAFVVSKQNNSVIKMVRQDLARVLPRYMIPDNVVPLKVITKLNNGKLDYKTLENIRPELGRELPRQKGQQFSLIEKRLISLWAKILRKANIEVDDNFFALGGHSLQVIELLFRINEEFQADIAIADFMQTPTIEKLAEEILDRMGLSKPAMKRRHYHKGQLVPLSREQYRIWFLHEFAKNNPFYNMPRAFRLEGRLDVLRLEKVICMITAAHSILRVKINNAKKQYIGKMDADVFSCIDLSDLPVDLAIKNARRRMREMASTPMRLKNGVLFKACLFLICKNLHYLFFNVHHIICDNWSLNILMRDIAEQYNSKSDCFYDSRGGHHYFDYIDWQKKVMTKERIHRALHYWRQELYRCPGLVKLPFDFQREPISQYKGRLIQAIILNSSMREIRDVAKSRRCSVFPVLLAGFFILLHQCTQESDIVIGTTFANRLDKAFENTVGFYANTLPVRLEVQPNFTIGTMIDVVANKILEASRYQSIPFEEIVEDVLVARHLDRNPLFQTAFVYLTKDERSLNIDSIKAKYEVVDSGSSKFDLTFYVEDVHDATELTIEYDTGLFRKSTIMLMLNNFKQILSRLSFSMSVSIGELCHGSSLAPIQRASSDVVVHHLRQIPRVLTAELKNLPVRGQVETVCFYMVDDCISALKSMGNWECLYDEIYSSPEVNSNNNSSFVGWNSSYTRQKLPDEEMHDWLQHTLDLISRLSPRNVLEIGAGSGLLALNLCQACGRYIATDISREAIMLIDAQRSAMGISKQSLSLYTRDALHSFRFKNIDTVVLNSTVQYFSGREYLLKTIKKAVNILKPSGQIFIGDVRNLDMVEEFYASIEKSKSPDVSDEQLKKAVIRRVLNEKELLISPSFFSWLKTIHPEITNVYMRKKPSVFKNELIMFRYDVVLFIGGGGRQRSFQTDPDMFSERVSKWPWINAPHYNEIDSVELNGRLLAHIAVNALPDRFIAIPWMADCLIENIDLLIGGDARAAEARIDCRSVTEKKVVGIWQKVFKCDMVKADTDFFSIGGNSLVAIQMTALLNREFNINLDIQMFFTSPTIEKISGVIDKLRNSQTVDIATVIPLVRDGVGKTIFLIHPVGGTVFCYHKLARLLQGSGFSCYAIQDPGILHGDVNFKDVSECAKYYINLIKIIQPKGPYVLGGFSSGGIIAYEMMGQLIDNDEEVGTLFLIDSWSQLPSKYREKDWFDKAMLKQMKFFEEKFLPKGMVYDREKWLGLLWRRMKILLEYQSAPLEANVTLFKAAEVLYPFSRHDAVDNYWGKMAIGRFITIAIEGNHDSMLLNKGVSTIAETIKRYFASQK